MLPTGKAEMSPNDYQCKQTHIKKLWVRKSCSTMLHSNKVEKLCLKDLLNFPNRPERKNLVKKFSELVEDFIPFLLDSIFYKSMILIYLTYSNSDSRFLSTINAMYMKTFWRRLFWASRGNREKCSMTFAKMFLLFKKIEKWKDDLFSLLPEFSQK